jgi:hypothetical protein
MPDFNRSPDPSRFPIGSAAFVLLGGLLLAGCAKQQAAAPVAAAPVLAATLPAGLAPEASILDLMLDFVDPNADDLWNSVATVSTPTGVEDHHPRTDEEWKQVRRKALVLTEAANLLVTAGRPVAHPGQQLAEPGGKGDYTPAEAQAEIDKDRGAFVGFAGAMQNASRQLLGAIDKRDVDAFLEAGGALDEACEACHRQFWYPNSPLPPGL